MKSSNILLISQIAGSKILSFSCIFWSDSLLKLECVIFILQGFSPVLIPRDYISKLQKTDLNQVSHNTKIKHRWRTFRNWRETLKEER